MLVDSAPLLEPLTGVIQEALKLAVEWFGQTGPAIYPDMVEVMESTRKHGWNHKCVLGMGDRKLHTRIARSTWWVILDRSLPWNEHKEYKCVKTMAALLQIRRATGKK